MIFKLDLHYDWLDLHSSPSRNVFCINVNGLKSDFMFFLMSFSQCQESWKEELPACLP